MINLKDFFNPYSLKARFAPAVLASFFFTFLYVEYISDKTNGSSIENSMLVYSTVVGLTLIFVFSSLIRSIGKYLIEQKMFTGKLNMPTTQLLLENTNSRISKSKKEQIITFFKDDLQIDFKERKQILKDQPAELKREISEAVAILRNKTKDNALVLRANQSYGLWRNCSGAISLCIFFLLILTVISFFKPLIPFSVLILSIIICLILLFTSLLLTKKYAFEYAEILYTSLIE